MGGTGIPVDRLVDGIVCRYDAKTAEDFAAVPDALRTLLEGAKGARPSSALALPVSLPPKLRVTGAQRQHMPIYLRRFSSTSVQLGALRSLRGAVRRSLSLVRRRERGHREYAGEEGPQWPRHWSLGDRLMSDCRCGEWTDPDRRTARPLRHTLGASRAHRGEGRRP